MIMTVATSTRDWTVSWTGRLILSLYDTGDILITDVALSGAVETSK
jgi:hypothetical protein